MINIAEMSTDEFRDYVNNVLKERKDEERMKPEKTEYFYTIFFTLLTMFAIAFLSVPFWLK